MRRVAGLAVGLFVCVAVTASCGSPTSPAADNRPPSGGEGAPLRTFAVSGAVTDRLTGAPVDGLTITFSALNPVYTRSAAVVGGSYVISDLASGPYDVTIVGS